MYLSTLALAERLGVCRDDVVRLFTRGVIERPAKGQKNVCQWTIENCPKLAELLSLTPAELTARGIINTSLLYTKEN